MPKSPALPPKFTDDWQQSESAFKRLHWKPAVLHGRFPTHIRPWLTDRSSLTAKLKRQCQQFSVQRLFEGRALPLPSEQQKLKIPHGKNVWSRCVLLLCNGQPVVYARTLIPNFTPGNPWLKIQQLGNQPLGELLFQLPNLQRSTFEFTQTQIPWPYLPAQPSSQDTYARQCLFHQAKAPLLLTEVFLRAPCSGPVNSPTGLWSTPNSSHVR